MAIWYLCNYDLVSGDFGGVFDLTGMDQLARVHLGVCDADECIEILQKLPSKSLRTLHLTIGSKYHTEVATWLQLHEVLIGLHNKMNNKPLGFWTNRGHDKTVSLFRDFVNRIGITMDEKLFAE